MKIKTRFAPSPTGYLHIGGARTALYSWLFARSLGGKFVLRIEDTDSERSSQSSIKAILNSMTWLNLDWDEGPYFQTKRLNYYNTVIDYMLSHGTAYKCYCSKERLEMLRKIQIACGKKPRYDGRCRNKKNDSLIKNKPYVVRFSNPQHGSVVFKDLIHGIIKFNNQELDDLIIRRTDGLPTYNFCAAVDDYDMKITHVIRGEDHISNTPRQINILKAINAPIPNYAHVSIILGNDGRKLSKRHGAIGVMQYRENGFLPEALLNYLVRLGWSHGNQEIFSVDDMKRLFSLSAMNKSSSVFNTEKLLWLNHYYINHLSANYVATHLLQHVKQQKIDIHTGPKLEELVKLLGERYKTLKEIAMNCHYLYKDFSEFDAKVVKKHLQATAIPALKTVRDKLSTLKEWRLDLVHAAIKNTAEELQISMNKVSMPLRVAVTGTDRSPAIDTTVYTVGRSRSLKRINLALNFIEQQE